MPRYKLSIEYDGTDLFGWQKQPEGNTGQNYLEAAIKLFCGEEVNTICAGRTDSGVHARGQVAHIDLSKDHADFQVMQAINFHLVNTPVAVVKAEKVSDDFNARFSAIRRRYFYRIINRSARLTIDQDRAWLVHKPLDATTMHEAAQLLVGTHDFTTFRDTLCQAKSPIKTLEELRIERQGDELHIHTAARSFLHHQVRNMVGSLVLVGRGKWSKDDLAKALAAKDRRAGGPTAPAAGLYFMEVTYP